MAEEKNEAVRKGRPPKSAEGPAEPVNTIIDLGAPKIVVTKPEPEPEVEAEVYISPQTKLEMEVGRKALGR